MTIGALNEKPKKIVSYDFTVDNIIAVKAPVGTDPETLIDQALAELIQRCKEGDVTLIFESIFDPDTGDYGKVKL